MLGLIFTLDIEKRKDNTRGSLWYFLIAFLVPLDTLLLSSDHSVWDLLITPLASSDYAFGIF
jgi:hypothetical protein